MSKPFLILQLRPEDETADSEFKKFLEVGVIGDDEVERIRLEKSGVPDIDLDNYTAIIVGGSPFDVTTLESEKSGIQKEIEIGFSKLLDKVVERNFPFLGACSGCGLLGSYCKGEMSREVGEDVGGVDVFITEEGKEDPLLKGFDSPFRALVGHKEGCASTPPGSVLLAYSETCPVQMFRLGTNVYATQFHPEADAEEFEIRINVYKHYGYFPPETAQDLIDAVKNEETPVPKEVLKRFVERARSLS